MKAYQLFLIPGGTFLLGVMIVFLPGLIFSFIGSTMQVIGMTVYGLLIGMQARNVTTGMVDELA